MKALNRTLPKWFARIRSRQITLPRFQRMEAWDNNAISELLTTVLRELPAGATLILEVGDKEKFLSRTMVDAPTEGERITEQLLDGQQRLTALWRSLHDKYPDRTYLVGFEEDQNHNGDQRPFAFGQSRWLRNGSRYPFWVDEPLGCWERNLIPVSLLNPDVSLKQIREWVSSAVGDDQEQRDDLFDVIIGLQEKVKNFNIPYLSLPVETPREVALDVFVKMNTSSVKLSTYDIVVALVEDAADESLHDLVDKVKQEVPRATDYADLPNLVLDVAALQQNRTPNNAGYKGLDFPKMVENWDKLVLGIKKMVQFLEEEKIFDAQRLPSYPAIPVVAALWEHLPKQPDDLGNAYHLLRQYIWHAFLTSRYERSSANHALQDFRGLKKKLAGNKEEDSIPIFNKTLYGLPIAEEIALAEWPKRRTILGRGLLALQIKCGAYDIADGASATVHNVAEREYHHLFPNSKLQDAEIARNQIFRSVNCALITWRTNRTISNKDPILYLKERADNSTLGEDELRRRLRTHLIPYHALAVGDYGEIEDKDRYNQQLQEDYQSFISARSRLLAKAVSLACEGKALDLNVIFAELD